MKNQGYLLFFLLILFGCEEKELKFTLRQRIVLNEIPSASGITKFGDGYFVIGDDSPYLFKLNSKFQIDSKKTIFSTDSLTNGRILKKIKPDFEAIEFWNDELMILGSGSEKPQRDLCLKWNPNQNDSIKTYRITHLYNMLRKDPKLDSTTLNIEGLAQYENHTYLLNRGKNLIFEFSTNELNTAIEKNQKSLPYRVYSYNLPAFNDTYSGFSGATAVPGLPYLFFTSSLETNATAYDDGKILGSYVGIIPITSTGLSGEYKIVMLPVIDQPLKVESITINKIKSKNLLEVILITDSDGGESLLLVGDLEY